MKRQPWFPLWSNGARFRRGIPDSKLAQALTPPRDIPLELEGQGVTGDIGVTLGPLEVSIPDVEIARVGDRQNLSAIGGPSDSLLLPQLSPVPPTTDGECYSILEAETKHVRVI